MNAPRCILSLLVFASASLTGISCTQTAVTTPPDSALNATCTDENAATNVTGDATDETNDNRSDVTAAPAQSNIRNVILLIGDGMGPQQIGLLELYARYANDPAYPDHISNIGRMIQRSQNVVVVSTPSDGLVNESATGATQLATGLPTRFGYLGIDADGAPVDSAIAFARSLGMRTGIISDTRLTHATPASFGAHVHDRWDETTIAEQMITSGTDVMLSGGWRYFIPHSATNRDQRARYAELFDIDPSEVQTKRDDERDLLDEAREEGYTVVTTPAALRDAAGAKLLGLFGAAGMQSGTQWLEDRDNENRSQPTPNELFRSALPFLTQDADKGFFLMIEGGQIDWAGHATKAQLLLHEMLRFDALVGEVVQWATEDGETAVVLTADHETGGFSIHYDRSGPPQPSIFADLDAFPNYVTFATSAHTHTPVIGTFLAPQELTDELPGLVHQIEVGQLIRRWIRLAAESR